MFSFQQDGNILCFFLMCISYLPFKGQSVGNSLMGRL